MLGIKIYEVPDDLNLFIEKIRDLHINSIFLGDSAIKDTRLINLLNSNGIDTYFVFQTFYNPDYLKEHPEAYAITENNNRAIDEWVEFVCPTNPQYIDFLIKRVESVINDYNPTGLSLDFIRQFIFWEKVYNSSSSRLVKSCCCSRCQNDNRDSEEVITDIVKLLSNKARQIKPDIIVDLHAVPWKKDEYNVGALSISGQNLSNIAKYVDFITPMCYTQMLKKEPEWINDLVIDQYNQTKLPVIPAIQASECYIDRKISNDEYKDILLNALKEPSAGIIIWKWDDIKSGEKYSITKKLFTQNKFPVTQD